MDREDRAGWRDIQKLQADIQVAKIQADIQAAKIQAEADGKKRADEIQMAQIEADKELKLKEMELKANFKRVPVPQLILPLITEILSHLIYQLYRREE